MPDYYVKDADGNYTVAEHPDTARVKEFRESNIGLVKKLADYEGLDPVAARAALAKVAAGKVEDVGALKTALATAEGKLAAAQAETTALTRRHMVETAFLAAGGQPSAVDLIVMKAPADAEKLTDWLAEAAISKELGFAFRPSTGGGANSSPRLLGASTANELRDPTPQQLGQHAKAIKDGQLKVVYTNS